MNSNNSIKHTKQCNHRILTYLGIQQTTFMTKFIYLCNCQICNSTIAIEEEFITDKTGAPFINSK